VSVPLETYLQSNFGLGLREATELALTDTYFFCKGIAGFTRLGRVHKELATFLERPSLRKGAIMPRGTAKSSIIKGRLLQHIIQDSNVRILYISKTKDRAEQGVKDMRQRITGVGAPLLPLLFPRILPENLSSVRWTASAFEVNRTKSWDEATVEAAGIGTNKVGFHYDILFFDDPLAPDKDDVRAEDIYFNPEVVSKTVGYMQMASIGNIDHGSPLQLIYFAGTRYSINDAIAWMKRHWPDMEFFEHTIYEADGFTTAFPNFWSTEQIEEEKRSQGTFFFRAQMLNDPVDPATKVFHTSRIQEYKTSPKYREGFLTVTVDPASGERGAKKSQTAILAAMTTTLGKVYVIDYVRDYLGSRDTVDAALKMCRRYDPDILGFESVGYQSQLQEYLKEAMRVENCRFLIEPITRGRASKPARLMKIQPVLENDDLYLKAWMTELTRELEEFPHGSKDLLDTLADHIALASKFSGKLAFRLRRKNIHDSIIEQSEIPEYGESLVCIYMEQSDSGVFGFIIHARKVDDVLYLSEAYGVGGGEEPWIQSVMQLPKDVMIVTTPDVADTFLRDVPNKVVKRKIKTAFPAEAAIQAVDSGRVVLTQGSQALTSSASESGLHAIQLLVENSKSREIRAILV